MERYWRVLSGSEGMVLRNWLPQLSNDLSSVQGEITREKSPDNLFPGMSRCCRGKQTPTEMESQWRNCWRKHLRNLRSTDLVSANRQTLQLSSASGEKFSPTTLAPYSEFVERSRTSKLLSFNPAEIFPGKSKVLEEMVRNFSLMQEPRLAKAIVGPEIEFLDRSKLVREA